MNISSRIMALTMTAMLTAAPAFAADMGSSSSTTRSINSGSSINNTSGLNTNTSGNLSGSSNINSSGTSSNVNTSGNASTSTGMSDVNGNGSMSTNVSSGKNAMSETQRVKSNNGLHRCGGNRGNGVGNMCSLSLTSMDKNKNGMISRSEFRKRGLSAKLFNKIDVNHNGIISKSELSAYNKGKVSGVNRVKTR